MHPKPKLNDNQQPAGQQNQAAMDDDEYSSGGNSRRQLCLFRGEGVDNSIRNEKIALDAKTRGDMPPVVYPDIPSEEGQPTRLASKNGNIVKIDHETQYRANWEAYKKQHYPAS